MSVAPARAGTGPAAPAGVGGGVAQTCRLGGVVAGSEVSVAPLEAIDGTPVLDLKPVLCASDA